MSTFNREIGGVDPNNYVQQGVVDNSASRAITELGGIALEADKQFASARLAKDLEGMRTAYLAVSPSAIQDANETLSQGDSRELNALRSTLRRQTQGVEQGAISPDMLKIAAEHRLRAAIARRPGLAQEFRQVAADVLGIDVHGAEMRHRLQRDAALQAASEKEAEDTRDTKGARERLAAIGLNVEGMQDQQMWEVYAQQFDRISERTQLEARTKTASEMVNLRDHGIVLNEDQNTFLAETAYAEIREALVVKATEMRQLVAAGGVTPEAFSDTLMQYREELSRARTNITSMRGRASDASIDRMVTEISALEEQVEGWISGAADTDFTEERIRGIIATVELEHRSDPAISAVAGVARVLGPEISNYIIGSSTFTQRLVTQAFTSAIAETSNPELNMQAAPMAIDAWLQTALDARQRLRVDTESVSGFADYVSFAMAEYAHSEPGQWDWASFSSGNSSAVGKLWQQRQALANHFSDEQKQDVSENLAFAGVHAEYMAQRELEAIRSPLAAKLYTELSADGNFYHPREGVELAPREQAELRRLNEQAGGRKIVGVLDTLTGDAGERLNRIRNEIAAEAGPTQAGLAGADVARREELFSEEEQSLLDKWLQPQEAATGPSELEAQQERLTASEERLRALEEQEKALEARLLNLSAIDGRVISD